MFTYMDLKKDKKPSAAIPLGNGLLQKFIIITNISFGFLIKFRKHEMKFAPVMFT